MNLSLFTKKYLQMFLSLLFGSIGVLSYSPFDFWPAAILSILFLLLLTIEKNIKQSFIIGFLWGIGFFGTGINWIYVSLTKFTDLHLFVNIFIIILLIIYLSLYPGIFGALLTYFTPKTNIWRLCFFSPALWQSVEFLRSFILTGFPWLQFGYTQINGPIKSLAPIFGVEMLTFLLFNITGLITLSIIRKNILILFYSIFFLFFLSLTRNLKWTKTLNNEKIIVSLVQGNIKQSLNWEPNFLKKIKNIYINLSKPYIGKSNIIIWPESAIPSLEFENQFWLKTIDEILKKSNTNLITGIIDIDQKNTNNKLLNSIIVLGNKTQYKYPTKNRYDKHHLVPFGEFLPIEKIIKPIMQFLNFKIPEFSKGNYKQKQLIVNNINITAAICYEIILGTQIHDNFNTSSKYLLTVSNDVWFGKTIGPWQHLQMARMRSLELGRPLIYATNNGITAIINSYGSIQNIIPQFKTTVLTSEIYPSIGTTPYVFWGNIPTWIITIIFIIVGYILNRNK
ncbi:apolipoprotein N-acyltransferase [Candidatus Providencia siddallii]|uniref:Apolipoprotein N-acyltransferase n=1 Tax=Candidatus Providencia siddallii TaxID=1715285 RepID=A0ABM9NNE9_9GAMM